MVGRHDHHPHRYQTYENSNRNKIALAALPSTAARPYIPTHALVPSLATKAVTRNRDSSTRQKAKKKRTVVQSPVERSRWCDGRYAWGGGQKLWKD